jgi:Phage tail protein
MIKSVKVTNHLGESITLELRFPEKSGFLIRAIDGLGPSKANINTTEISTSDGSMFNSSRVNSRNIVLQLTFLDKPTIEDTRLLSYKYFPIKKRITMEFETDNRIAYVAGYVESNTPNIFSVQEGTSISIICPDSYFYELDREVTSFSDTMPIFEFPFSNEHLTSNLLTMSETVRHGERTINYYGDAAVGVFMFLHAIGIVGNIEIINMSTSESIKLNTMMEPSDDIIISTVKGNKFILLQRDAVITNILHVRSQDSKWFQLETGENLFVYTVGIGDADDLEFRIENQIAYEGI